MADPFDLERFVQAQAPVMPTVLWELCHGRKQTHWMWFVFPQLCVLGQSATAKRYGISSLDEARVYMAHPVLGPRLVDCARLVLAVQGRTAQDIFGSIDALKLRSSMTLFGAAALDAPVFDDVIRKYYDSVPDERTRDLLAGA